MSVKMANSGILSRIKTRSKDELGEFDLRAADVKD